jgi:hypothetical protein
VEGGGHCIDPEIDDIMGRADQPPGPGETKIMDKILIDLRTYQHAEDHREFSLSFHEGISGGGIGLTLAQGLALKDAAKRIATAPVDLIAHNCTTPAPADDPAAEVADKPVMRASALRTYPEGEVPAK